LYPPDDTLRLHILLKFYPCLLANASQPLVGKSGTVKGNDQHKDSAKNQNLNSGVKNAAHLAQ